MLRHGGFTLEHLEGALSQVDITELTADVVKAFVANNAIPASELKTLVESVHATFSRLSNVAAPQPAPAPVATASMIRESVTPDFLISLENGKKYRTLRFHLAKLGMSPEAYRQKWRLPPDYPMVAASFAARRSALAKASGFGKSRKGKSSRGVAKAAR
ncbi:MAG: MucR family transcriptional regulator [Pseudomonadota bacterium]|nr:MucR family transcriptional regulator [Pseudomonadota bacterium]